MGSTCSCFDGISVKRGALDRPFDPAKQTLISHHPTHPPPPVAAADVPIAGESPLKRERSARTIGSEVTEEPMTSARSDACSSPGEGAMRETTDEQAPSPRIPSTGNGSDAQMGLSLPSALAGTWRYHETATYELNQITEVQWRFDEMHDSGRAVTGILQLNGFCLKGLLTFTDTSEECGRIRMVFVQEENVICSNFSPRGADWWSRDMIATRELPSSQCSRSSRRERRGRQASEAQAEVHQNEDAPADPSPRRQAAAAEPRRARRDGRGSREGPERDASLRSSGRSLRSSSGGGGRLERQGLEMIPTRVLAKLERSKTNSKRRRTPSYSGKGRPQAGQEPDLELPDDEHETPPGGIAARQTLRSSDCTFPGNSILSQLPVANFSKGGRLASLAALPPPNAGLEGPGLGPPHGEADPADSSYCGAFPEAASELLLTVDPADRACFAAFPEVSHEQLRTDRQRCCSGIFHTCCRSRGESPQELGELHVEPDITD